MPPDPPNSEPPNRPTASSALPLSNLRILDIGTRIAAPFAATLLGDFGAEVIKVELPGSGDFMRGIGPFDADGHSLWWAVEGRNKQSITLDLRRPRGQDLFRALVRKADVVVENFQPGTLEGWGLGPDELARVNPDLILTRASVYGQSGPYRDRPGLDRNGIGFGGLLYLTGYPDRPPVRPGIIISDYLTGVFNALAIMIALYHRDVHRGGGQTADLALYESIFRVLEHTLPAYDRLGIVRGREGNRLKNSAPLDNWPTGDGQSICIVAAGDGLFPRLARAIGRPELLDDARFATSLARVGERAALTAALEAHLARADAAEWITRLNAAGVPSGPINDMAEVFADPQVRAREMFVELPHPQLGTIKTTGVPVKLSATPAAIERLPPELGADTDAVLGEAGFSAEEIAALRGAGVV